LGQAQDTAGGVGDKAKGGLDQAKDTVGGGTDKAKSTAGGLKDSGEQTIGDAGDKVGDLKNQTGDKAGDLKNHAGDTVNGVGSPHLKGFGDASTVGSPSGDVSNQLGSFAKNNDVGAMIKGFTPDTGGSGVVNAGGIQISVNTTKDGMSLTINIPGSFQQQQK
jgi:hypothetical protein